MPARPPPGRSGYARDSARERRPWPARRTRLRRRSSLNPRLGGRKRFVTRLMLFYNNVAQLRQFRGATLDLCPQLWVGARALRVHLKGAELASAAFPGRPNSAMITALARPGGDFD